MCVALLVADPVGLGGESSVQNVDDATLIASLNLAVAALMWLAPSSPGIATAQLASALSAFNVPEPTVISYAAMSLWGLCHNETNRVEAVTEGGVQVLARWTAMLLLACADESNEGA
jgi:hypothetical protein